MTSNEPSRDKAIANCSDKPVVQAGGDRHLRAWQSLGPNQIIDLLAEAGPQARIDAQSVLRLLARQPWRIKSTLPGDAERNARIPLSVAGRTYDMHCQQMPGLQVVQITA